MLCYCESAALTACRPGEQKLLFQNFNIALKFFKWEILNMSSFFTRAALVASIAAAAFLSSSVDSFAATGSHHAKTAKSHAKAGKRVAKSGAARSSAKAKKHVAHAKSHAKTKSAKKHSYKAA